MNSVPPPVAGPPAAPTVPADLVHYLRGGRCVLFAGAGLSAWGQLPTWQALMARVVGATQTHLAGRDDIAGELARLVEAGKYLDVADYCKDKLGEAQYHALLAQHLSAEGSAVPEPHRLIAGLPFSAVVTTNFDRLLERAYAERGLGWPKTLTQLDLDPLAVLLFAGTFFVLKAHGDVDRPESVVLTTRDYAGMIHENAAFGAMLSTMLLTRAILFVGYSLADVDFRLLFERQLSTFRGYVPVRYSLMSGVTSVEADVLFRSTGVKVIPYDAADGHDAVLAFLRALDRAVGRGRRRDGAGGVGDASRDVEPRVPARGWRAAHAATALAPVRVVRPSSTPPGALELTVRVEGRAVEAVLATVGVTGGRDIIARGVREFPALPSFAHILGDALTSYFALAWEDYQARMGRAIARCLPLTVRRALEDVGSDALVVLRLTRELEPLPWELLWLKDDFLCRRVPVARAPWGSRTRRAATRSFTARCARSSSAIRSAPWRARSGRSS